MTPCEHCGGEGRGPKACPPCSGLGKHDCSCGHKAHTCGACLGSGLGVCPICEGRGYFRAKRRVAPVSSAHLTRVISKEYITRNNAETETETGPELPGVDPIKEYIMKYGTRKIDLETADPAALKYRDAVVAVLTRNAWNVTKAAKALHLSRSSLYRRIHILSIKVPPQSRGRRGRSIFDHKIAGVK